MRLLVAHLHCPSFGWHWNFHPHFSIHPLLVILLALRPPPRAPPISSAPPSYPPFLPLSVHPFVHQYCHGPSISGRYIFRSAPALVPTGGEGPEGSSSLTGTRSLAMLCQGRDRTRPRLEGPIHRCVKGRWTLRPWRGTNARYRNCKGYQTTPAPTFIRCCRGGRRSRSSL